MLAKEELESIYELLHSPVEDNVSLALAILESPENFDAKKELLQPIAETYNRLYMISDISDKITYQNITLDQITRIMPYLKIRNELDILMQEDD